MAFVYWIRKPEHVDMFSEGYIGVTTKSVDKRFRLHCQLAFSQKDSRKSIVHKAILSYGPEALIVETLLIADRDYCYEVESKLRPEEMIGWNVKAGGYMAPADVEAKRLKLSEQSKKREYSEEFKEKLRTMNIGRKASEEARKNMSLARKGEKHSPEWVEKIAKTKRGVPLTEEHKRKVSEGNKGKKLSEETKARMSAARKLVKLPPRSEEAKQKTKDFWANQNPWEHFNITTDVWTKAREFYEFYQEGKSRYVAGNRLGYSRGSLVAMWKRFDSGWNPNKDDDYIQWLNTQ